MFGTLCLILNILHIFLHFYFFVQVIPGLLLGIALPWGRTGMLPPAHAQRLAQPGSHLTDLIAALALFYHLTKTIQPGSIRWTRKERKDRFLEVSATHTALCSWVRPWHIRRSLR